MWVRLIWRENRHFFRVESIRVVEFDALESAAAFCFKVATFEHTLISPSD